MNVCKQAFVDAYVIVLKQKIVEICRAKTQGNLNHCDPVTGQFNILPGTQPSIHTEECTLRFEVNFDGWAAYKRFKEEARDKISEIDVNEVFAKLLPKEVPIAKLIDFCYIDPWVRIKYNWQQEIESHGMLMKNSCIVGNKPKIPISLPQYRRITVAGAMRRCEAHLHAASSA